jgi:FOG: Ankyrin repeat
MTKIALLALVAASIVMLSGCTTLHKAAERNDIVEVRRMIDKGADVNSVDSAGDTPLMKATWRGHTEIAKLLIEKGANVNSVSNNGNTPLTLAAGKGYIEIAKMLIEQGANVNSVTNNGDTPLTAAAWQGHTEIAKLLVEKGADLSMRIKDGRTALELAEQFNHTETYNAIVASKLNTLISRNDKPGLRAYFDVHPEALSAIEDAHLRLLYTGPAELRIIDIAQLVKNKNKDSLIIAQINSTAGPYKRFTINEITELKKMAISDAVVAAMIAVTTEYNKDQKRLAEQQAAQVRAANEQRAAQAESIRLQRESQEQQQLLNTMLLQQQQLNQIGVGLGGLLGGGSGQAIQPPPVSNSINCTSRALGSQVFTNCN